jgi:hypothetical protein
VASHGHLKKSAWLEFIALVACLLILVYGLSPVPGYTPPDNGWYPSGLAMALDLKSLHFIVGTSPGCDLMATGVASRQTAVIQFSPQNAALAQSLGFDTAPHEITRTQYLILLNDIQAALTHS